MILHVPKETLIDGFSAQLKKAGLGVIAKKGEYILVQRATRPQQFYDVFVGPEIEEADNDQDLR